MMTNDRARPGPKPKPDDEKVLKKTISLQPQTHDGLLVLGDGVLSRGVEIAYQATQKSVAKKGKGT